MGGVAAVGLLSVLNVPATAELYTLSLHDALPILHDAALVRMHEPGAESGADACDVTVRQRVVGDQLRERAALAEPGDEVDALLGEGPTLAELIADDALSHRQSRRLNSSRTVMSYS